MKHSLPRLLLLAAICSLVALTAAPGAWAADAATTPAPAADAPKDAKAEAAKDEASAAERRAKSSEFEREKLDQGAFAKEEAASSGKGDGGSDSGGSVLRFIFGLVVVLGAIFGVHWLLKKWGQSRLQGVAGRTGVIDVVATTNLAQGRSLHLVRVGPELVLVGATEQSITRIGEVDSSVLMASSGNSGNSEFQSMLSGAMLTNQPGVPQGMGGTGSARDPFLKRFVDNLRLSTAR